MPIISAAAVAAVRPGLRCAFLSASRPAAAAEPPRRDADELRERLDEPGREHRDPDEERQHADSQQGESVAGGDVVGERAVGES